MDTLRSLKIFVRAADLGSLSAVAREHATTQPTVSKLVAGLEKSLGVQLLERTTTRLDLTEEGKRLYGRAKQILEAFDDAVQDVRGLTLAPSGLLRVNVPLSLGELRLNALMLKFLNAYPEIKMELILSDRFVDLIEDGIDVALRLGGTLPPNVVAKRIGVSERYLVCASAYLKGRPRIRHPRDLEGHEAIRFSGANDIDIIELTGPNGVTRVGVSGRYRVSSSVAVREALLAGVGYELAPAWLIHDLLTSKSLVRLLPRWRAPSQEAFLLYQPRRHQPLRVRALIQFLLEEVPRLPGFSR